MTINRRFLLKGMALSGLAGLAMAGPVRALAGQSSAPSAAAAARPVLALVSAGAAESVFLRGAQAAAGSQLQVQRFDQDLDRLLSFERQLRSGQPLRVIGLLDDATATLVLDMARSAGARVQWLGQHNTVAGVTQHRLLNTEVAEGCARQISRQLHACGAGFHIAEERQGSLASPRQLSAPARGGEHAAEWASAIGYQLASLGGRPAKPAPAPASTVLSGSFVSFSIEA
ncbi:TPA: hypothetical protein L3923_006360 [Pseudomonas aeruginosa]|uniref:hypothetical protein n=1 Tax=Stutzerimonas stutzeri TaxID=316 RepID=UPI00249FFC62|nr:hypothetical protein [Stutzerimonas stutzeri]GLZ27609.1 hypothetical protein Pstu01_42780 [Stutzerimonas stutzeri]HBN9751834.1 hypothetical protein [Pseudomonas aeruginosa]